MNRVALRHGAKARSYPDGKAAGSGRSNVCERRFSPGSRAKTQCEPPSRLPMEVGVAEERQGGPGQQRQGGPQVQAVGGPNSDGREGSGRWPGEPRLQDESVDSSAGLGAHRGADGRPIPSRTRLASAGRQWVQLPTPRTSGDRARRSEDTAVEAGRMAGDKKKARKEGRTIVFIDESGLSTRPTRVRTWAPRGKTPVIQETLDGRAFPSSAECLSTGSTSRSTRGASRVRR